MKISNFTLCKIPFKGHNLLAVLKLSDLVIDVPEKKQKYLKNMQEQESIIHKMTKIKRKENQYIFDDMDVFLHKVKQFGKDKDSLTIKTSGCE